VFDLLVVAQRVAVLILVSLLGVFIQQARAQALNVGTCVGLYQEHMAFIAKAPPEATPRAQRFLALNRNQVEVERFYNSRERIERVVSQVRAQVAQNEENLRKFERGQINIIYADESNTKKVKHPVAFLEWNIAEMRAAIAFMECRIHNLPVENPSSASSETPATAGCLPGDGPAGGCNVTAGAPGPGGGVSSTPRIPTSGATAQTSSSTPCLPGDGPAGGCDGNQAAQAPGQNSVAGSQADPSGQPVPTKNVDNSQYARAAAKYIVDAAGAWATTKGLKEFTEPFNQMLDALTRADAAASGQVTCTIPAVEKLASYVDKEEDVLYQLAGKSESDWLQQSGVNDFDRSTIPAAQAYLDGWSGRLNTLQQLIERLVPLMTTWQAILANPGVVGAVVGSEQATTDFGLCGDAMSDIIHRLNLASSDIGKIRSQLGDARSLVY
jgi:hypothetical protein